MNQPASAPAFAGSVPELYEQLMVPLIFAPYAADLARRIAALVPSRVLETAAGTGAVTRALALALPADVEIVATDLNPPMLERAEAVGTARSVRWRQADAMQLPFDDASFDVVVCQFGAMFFPDRPHAYAEARRVLREGGRFVFNVWDRIASNDFPLAVMEALAALFPADPPRFVERVPHGYFDVAAISADVRRGGFGEPSIETVTERSRARSALDVATAFCKGTPMRAEIESRSANLAEVTAAVAAEVERRFGAGPIEGRIQAHVITVRRD